VTSASFWSNDERRGVWMSYIHYYDLLADAVDGTHRDLLETISYNPFMGVYLSHAQNRKADLELGTSPDENYAREIMQLFSVGVYSLADDGTPLTDNDGIVLENYTNDDITELAKVFTGLGLTSSEGVLDNFDSPTTYDYTRYMNPMVMSEDHHSTGTKTLLTGEVIPDGQTGDEDIAQSLDALATHPSTAPHIATLLIKRLTASNPSSAYVNRVVETWKGTGTYGNGEHGNLVNVFKAILLDPEARYSVSYEVDEATDEVTVTPVATSPDLGIDSLAGRIKEPIIKWLQFYRFSQALGADGDFMRAAPKTKFSTNDVSPDFGQIPMRAPSVFNFYGSGYSPSIGDLAEAEATYAVDLTSPESEILPSYIVRQFEEFHGYVNQNNPSSTFSYRSVNFAYVDLDIDYSYLAYLYEKNRTIDDFIDDINLWLCNGQISPTLRDQLIAIADKNGGASIQNFASILSVIFNSSDFSTAL